MKKTFKATFILLVVLGLVSVVFSPVFASHPVSTSMPDPIVTPLKTTYTYSSSIVEVGYLKGAVQNENQLMAPVGRTDEQFGSNGLILSDLTGKEKVKACFSFPGYNYKWAGNVYKWNGTKWVKQATTFTNDPAGVPTACASGLTNGTYALIIYYWGPQESVSTPEPV